MTEKINATEARQGETPHRVRYILLVSLAAAVVALTIIAAATGF